MTSSGTFTTLCKFPDAAFNGGTNDTGNSPADGLTRGADAPDGRKVLYGSTLAGGQYGAGTVFQIVTDGTPGAGHTDYTVLHHFAAGPFSAEGNNPGGFLALVGTNTLYGVAAGGGEGRGIIYKLVTSGTEAGSTVTPLAEFNGSSGPVSLNAGLIRGDDAPDGKLVFFGTSLRGVGNYDGTIFKLTTDGTKAHSTVTVLHTFDTSHPGIEPAAALVKGTDGNFYGVDSYTGESGPNGMPGSAYATVEVPVPAHATFYKAALVSLPAGAAAGQPGLLPGLVRALPATIKTTAPPLPVTGVTPTLGGTVKFALNFTMPIAAKYDFMVEYIVTSSAISTHGSFPGVTGGSVAIYDRAGTSPVRGERQAKLALIVPHRSSQPVSLPGAIALDASYLAQHLQQPLIGQIGIMKTVPQAVKAGDNFDVIFTVFNRSNGPASHVQLTVPLPANTQYVSSNYGQGSLIIGDYTGVPVPGDALDYFVSTGNGPAPGGVGTLEANSAAAVTITLKATGSVGSTIEFLNAYVNTDYSGNVLAPPATTTITATTPAAPLFNSQIAGGVVNHLIQNGNDLLLIDLNGGNIVAQGGGNLIGQDGNGIVAQGGGNIVAQGGGNLLGIGGTNAAALLASAPGIVAQGGGNLIGGAGAQLLLPDGAKAFAANIVAQGGGNIVAQGGGNALASAAGSSAALRTGAGNLNGAGGAGFAAH